MCLLDESAWAFDNTTFNERGLFTSVLRIFPAIMSRELKQEISKQPVMAYKWLLGWVRDYKWRPDFEL